MKKTSCSPAEKENEMFSKGYQVKVDITTGLDDYKTAFLAIYNNYKSDYRLLHFENDYHNGIYVTVDEEELEDTVKWLEQFGEVTHKAVYIHTTVPNITDAQWDEADKEQKDIICVLDE